MEETIINIIQNIGFPIFIALYLLIEFRKTLNTLTESLNNNTQAINELMTLVKHINSKNSTVEAVKHD